jgi:hypothetical protein
VVRVHYAGFTVFATTTVHALSTGADSRSPAFLLAVVSACVEDHDLRLEYQQPATKDP